MVSVRDARFLWRKATMTEPNPTTLEPTDPADQNESLTGGGPLERRGIPDASAGGLMGLAIEEPKVPHFGHARNANVDPCEFGADVSGGKLDRQPASGAKAVLDGVHAPMENVIPARIGRSMGAMQFGRKLRFWALSGLVLVSAGCNGGVVAAVASSSSGSESSNSQTSISGFTVDDDRQGTAMIRFFLTDAEGDSDIVSLAYQLPGGSPQSLTTLSGATNPALLNGSPNGTQHTLVWNYSAEAGLPSSSSFVADVQVSGLLPGVSASTEGVNSETRGLGNDVPVVLAVDATLGLSGDEVGVVPVQFTLADSSEDAVNVVVEFLRENELNPPGVGWQLATPAPLLVAPPEAFVDLATSTAASGGVGATFFWDTDIDLFQGDEPVRLRFTPRDEVATGLPVETGSFQVDNNEEPTVSILEGLFLANPDQRGGIPIPYQVADEEGDEVQVVFQWRRPSESFPALPSTVSEIQDVLDDPVQRRALQIATEYPTFIGGRVVPVDANTVRLPELATGEAPSRLDRIVGCELQILRASDIPSAPGWPQNPLDSPVAAIPIGEGLSAYVLDANAPGNWRLRETELATGVILTDLASGLGTPTALTLSSDERFVFVASFTGQWQVDRFDLTSGAALPAGSASGPFTSPDGIRGMAALVPSVALVTLDDTLLRVDFSQVLPTSAPVLTGLAEPWGVAIDPLQANHAYLALRTEHRVVDVDLNAQSFSDLPAEIFGGTGIPLVNPRAIALERGGTRLLVVTQRLGGKVFLRGLNLRASTDLDDDGQANPAIFKIEMDFDPLASLATGKAGLRALAVPDIDNLFIGGGIEQSRMIISYNSTRREALVAEIFYPTLVQSRRWRIPLSSCPVLPGRLSFVWDSRDVDIDDQLFLRVQSLDSEIGGSDETNVPKPIGLFASESVQLGDSTTTKSPRSVDVADLDGDGDLDIVSANANSRNLTVFFQIASGEFDSTPLELGNSITTSFPQSVRAADLDGDGDLDILSADGGDNLTVFFQLGSGIFDPTPLVLGDPITTASPEFAIAADMDGDGDLDLLSANPSNSFQNHSLTVFFQTSPGVFGPIPLTLGDSATPFSPRSLDAADLDGDGDLDIVSANSGTDNLEVFFQIDSGVFDSVPLVLGGPATMRLPYSVKAVDLDQDGDLDLVSANASSDNLTVFFQIGAGTFNPAPLVLGDSTTLDSPRSVESVDFDGDGNLDLICVNLLNDNLTVFFQTSPGVFDPTPWALGDSTKTLLPRAVRVADLDGDGDLDLVTANGNGDNLTVFFRNGPAAIDPAPTVLGDLGTTGGPFSVKAADLDQDGDLDIVSANVGSDNLTVFFQSGPGVFDGAPLVLEDCTTTNSPISVSAADLDGDGDLDLVSANVSSNNLAVFYQSGAGIFDSAPMMLGDSTTTDGAISVIAADLDGDGDLDLASANGFGDNLAVFFQSGAGLFDSVPLVLGDSTTMELPFSVKAADLDEDGDLDLVSANVSSNNLAVFYQSGAGLFDSAPLVLGDSATTGAPFSVEAADVDGDGDFDLVSANSDSDNLVVFFQIQPGLFDPAPLALGNILSTGDASSVKAADVDGDGDLDLFSANPGFASNNLTVFFQSSPGVFNPAPLILGGDADD